MGFLWVFGALAVLATAIGLALAVVVISLRSVCHARVAKSEVSKSLKGKETVGFFHPYAHAGGGGERVLWCAIHAIQQRHPGVQCVVFTGDVDVPKSKFLELARDRFGVEVKADSVHFVMIHSRHWVDAATWPRFTLLGQSLGSLVLGWEALCCCRPDVMIDSMGYAFTLPLFVLVGGCRVGCYVHYPTISTDMLSQVKNRDVSVCNKASIAKSPAMSAAKLVYYQAFASLYRAVGTFAEVVMVNSSWTRGHIDALWRRPYRTSIVYPPCDTSTLAGLPLERAKPPSGGLLILSLAQFRPEKDHPLQLRALAQLFKLAPERRKSGDGRARLILAGGCRDDGDKARVKALKELCTKLGLKERTEGAGGGDDWDVAFRTNVSMTEMKELLGQATIGLHTMREEHFGINVVEFMAAGAVALAHRSGGPLLDIVTPLKDGQITGYLASDEASYAAAMKEILELEPEARQSIASAARQSVGERFAQEAFEVAISDRMIAPLRKGTGQKSTGGGAAK